MTNVNNELIYRRLAELLEQGAELAQAAQGEILVYLFEMAKIELQSLRSGDVDGGGETFVPIKHCK